MATWKKVVVSGSAISQLVNDRNYGSLTGQGLVSGSSQISYTGITNKPAGIVSSSTQTISNLSGTGIVSSSAQIDTLFNIDGVISSSAQIAGLGAGIVSGSSQISFTGITNKPTLVSGSAQISVTNAIVAANAAIASSKINYDGTGIVSSSAQVGALAGVKDSTITIAGGNGVTVNGAANESFTLNQASGETITVAAPAGTVSGSANGATQGTVRINGIARSTGLETTANVTFATASITQNLSVGGNISAVGNLSVADATVTGNLTVQGSTTSLQTTNVNVEDQFILLNSGSAAADGGLVVNGAGSAIGWDQSEGRWALDFAGATWNQSAISSDAYVAAVVTSADANYAKVGNIRVDTGLGEIFIYV